MQGARFGAQVGVGAALLENEVDVLVAVSDRVVEVDGRLDEDELEAMSDEELLEVGSLEEVDD